jgi:hypothetical protein
MFNCRSISTSFFPCPPRPIVIDIVLSYGIRIVVIIVVVKSIVMLLWLWPPTLWLLVQIKTVVDWSTLQHLHNTPATQVLLQQVVGIDRSQNFLEAFIEHGIRRQAVIVCLIG